MGLRARPQPVHRYAILDGAGASYARIVPDLEVLDGERVGAVVDAKYKAYAEATADGSPTSRVGGDDLYQLAFYGAAIAEGPELFVVVPRGEGARLRDRWMHIRVGEQRLRLVEMDLSAVLREGGCPWTWRLRMCGR
jgi:5-methylcytosine-specific restriction endonuclease McrBC regulatory subunit McrC